jgi:hypothetical protein
MSMRYFPLALNSAARSMTAARWRSAVARLIGRRKLACANALLAMVVRHHASLPLWKRSSSSRRSASNCAIFDAGPWVVQHPIANVASRPFLPVGVHQFPRERRRNAADTVGSGDPHGSENTGGEERA